MKEEKELINNTKKIRESSNDKDDARIATSGKTNELEEIRKAIAIKLDEAIKQDMHMDPTRYIVESIPGKRTEIIISEYILNLNSLYKEETTKTI